MTKRIHYVEDGDEYVQPFSVVDEGVSEKRWKSTMKLFKNLLCKIRALRDLITEMSEKPSLCCTIYEPTYNFEVGAGDVVTIPFQNSVVEHPELPFANGVITPLRAGWYSVFAYCYDSYANGANTYNLHILGQGSGIVDWQVAAAPPFKLLGRQSVYCNGTTDTISAALSHSDVDDLEFNHLVGGAHRSYLNVNYIGTEPSGYITSV